MQSASRQAARREERSMKIDRSRRSLRVLAVVAVASAALAACSSSGGAANQPGTLVQNAIDSKVDGIAATLANPEAVGPVLKQAADAGIPTVAFNAGIDQYQQYGAKMYFGSDEDVAGQAVGTKLSQAGGSG